MHLSPRDIDKLMLHNAGFLAQKRYARGISLNYPEAVALISAQLLEFIREGDSVVTLMDKGKKILGIDDVMQGVADMIEEVQVEGTFPDGTKLVTVHHPICSKELKNGFALHGSGLTKSSIINTPDNIINPYPGKTFTQEGSILINEGREVISVEVINKGDRPVQVGSHYLFSETNSALEFDRLSVIGFRLNIPAGTAVRFEPGERKTIELVRISGLQIMNGGNRLAEGKLEELNLTVTEDRMRSKGFIK